MAGGQRTTKTSKLNKLLQQPHRNNRIWLQHGHKRTSSLHLRGMMERVWVSKRILILRIMVVAGMGLLWLRCGDLSSLRGSSSSSSYQITLWQRIHQLICNDSHFHPRWSIKISSSLKSTIPTKCSSKLIMKNQRNTSKIKTKTRMDLSLQSMSSLRGVLVLA